MIMMNNILIKLKKIFTHSKCTCKDCKNKVQVGAERYLCLMDNGLVTNYGKCCEKYSK